MENFFDTIGNRTRDLSACSAVKEEWEGRKIEIAEFGM
jgi:hypothetical protein